MAAVEMDGRVKKTLIWTRLILTPGKAAVEQTKPQIPQGICGSLLRAERYDCRKASRSAFTLSANVVHMPCGAPG